MNETFRAGDKIDALCIDDDKTAHEILVLFLADQYTIDFALTAHDALGMTAAKKYSIIFLDINLGRDVMNGLEFLKILRQNPDYYHVPVIAFTAYAWLGDKETFLSAGCDHYLAKPFSKANLMQVIAEVIQKK